MQSVDRKSNQLDTRYIRETLKVCLSPTKESKLSYFFFSGQKNESSEILVTIKNYNAFAKKTSAG